MKTRATQHRKSCSWERRQDKDGNIILNRGKICDFYDPYWRVEFSDGDWEGLTRRELRHGITFGGASLFVGTRGLIAHCRATSRTPCFKLGGSGADGSSSSFKTNLSFR